MILTIEMLLQGDAQILGFYGSAQIRWKHILNSDDADELETLAVRLASEQSWFEADCGGRWAGKEIMVATGFGHLYRELIGFCGNEELVLRLRDAFMQSNCSSEVKYYTERVAALYSIDRLQDDLAAQARSGGAN